MFPAPCPPPPPPHERLWLKSTWQLLCSALLPPLHLPFPSPSSPSLDAFLRCLPPPGGRRGGKAWLPHGVSFPGPSVPWSYPPRSSPEHRLTFPSCAPVAHWTVLHGISHPRPLGSRQGSCSGQESPGEVPTAGGQMWLFPHTVICQLQSQSSGGPLPRSLPIASIPPGLCRAPAPTGRVGDQTAPAPAHTQGTGGSSCPVPWDTPPSWHQAPLLCYKGNIQINQLTGFRSFPFFPIQNGISATTKSLQVENCGQAALRGVQGMSPAHCPPPHLTRVVQPHLGW